MVLADAGGGSCAIGAALILAFAGAVASAADPESSQVSSDPIFKAVMVDGKESSGRIVSFAADTITIANNEGGEGDPAARPVGQAHAPGDSAGYGSGGLAGGDPPRGGPIDAYGHRFRDGHEPGGPFRITG